MQQTPKSKPKSLLLITDRFPVYSETFVVLHAIDMLHEGYDVKILCREPQSSQHSSQQSLLEDHRLMERLVPSPPMPKSYLLRIATALVLATRSGLRGVKLLLRSLNPRRFGKQGLNLWVFFQTFPFLEASFVDVIHAHFGLSGVRAAWAKRLGLTEAPLVVTFHGFDANVAAAEIPAHRKLYREVFALADRLTVGTDFMARCLLELGAPLEKISFWPMGVDPKLFQSHPSSKPEGSQVMRLLSVGRLVPFKNHIEGIRAAELLVKKGYPIRYDIIGEGPLRGKLEAYIHDHQLGQHVFLLGKKSQEDILLQMQKAQVFLMTSSTDENGRAEGQGVVTLEAQASRLPVVAFRSGGVPDTMIDGVTGYLVPPGDVETYAKHIEWLLRNEKWRQKLGDHARKFVLERFSKEALKPRLRELYQF